MCLFFQAEDGIRDIGVTGVQTCALPIYLPRLGAAALQERREDVVGRRPEVRPHVRGGRTRELRGVRLDLVLGVAPGVVGVRSEERRGGKEWRSRWSPYH